MDTDWPVTGGAPKFVKALYSWSGEEKNDLGFVEGDLIEVLNTGDGNWWTGRLRRNKVVGSFPKNFVEPYNPMNKTSRAASPSLMSGKQQQSINEFDKSIADIVQELSISQPLSSSSGSSRRDDDIWDEENQYEGDTDTNEATDRVDTDYTSFENDLDEYSDYKEMPDLLDGPPPVPPPHGVSLNLASRASSGSTATATAATPSTRSNTATSEFDGTPSPLRNAMDDVLDSLGHMGDLSRNGSISYPQPLTERKLTSHDSSSTLTAPLHASPHKKMNGSADISSYVDSDEDEMPYDPESYSSLDKLARHSTSMHSMNHADDHMQSFKTPSLAYRSSMSAVNSHVARADTYKSVSSVNTNSLSIMSSSTTPTTISNDSVTSAGSLLRRREAINPPGVSINSYASYGESPACLPNAKPKSDSKTLKALKLKSSSGLLKKFFIGTNPMEKAQEEANDSLYSSTSLRRSVSRSSKMSTSSTSSRLRERLRGVSSMTFGMKSGSLSDGASSVFSRQKSISSSHDLESSTHWIEIRRDVHRANTLTYNEISQRRRNFEVIGVHICEPFLAMSLVQGEESYHGELIRAGRSFDFTKQNYSVVDEAILGIRTWPQLMTPQMFASSKIGRVFESEAEQVRAIFDFCAGKLVWEPSAGIINMVYDSDDDIMSSARIMQSKRATSQEIALCVKSMCDALDIVCTIVHGQLKMPGEQYNRSIVPKVNHTWNAVVVNDEWRFLDAALANPTFPMSEYYSNSSSLNRSTSQKDDKFGVYRADSIASSSGVFGQQSTNEINYFYFLTRPMHFIYTHVPCRRSQQHLIPPLQDIEALSLPIAGSQAFETNISLVNYHSGMTVLENLETAELNLVVPGDLELTAEVLAGNVMNLGILQGQFDDSHLTKIPALAQAYWKNNRRYVRVKAFLPEPFSQGILNIYARSRGAHQIRGKTNPPLIYSLGISHSGSNAPFEFFTRHPTPHCKRQDIYVTQPQCKRLVGGNSYVFEVRQHPSGGITSGAGFGRVKLAIQSPSGRIFKLRKKDCEESGSVFGVWEVNARCYEVGTWRGLVLADQGNAWSVFSEWDCV